MIRNIVGANPSSRSQVRVLVESPSPYGLMVTRLPCKQKFLVRF